MAKKKQTVKKQVMRFAALERVSTEKQAEVGTSLKRQHEGNERDAKAIAEGLGKVARVSHFRGSESGAEHQDHPTVEGMIVRCEQGEFDAVVCQAVDRFSRDDLQFLAWLRRLEKVRVYAFEKQVRLRAKDLPTRLKATIAGDERNKINERTWENRKHRQREGYHKVGTPPPGYRFDEKKKLFVVDKKHKKLIRKAMRRYLYSDIGFDRLADEFRSEWQEAFPKKYANLNARTLHRIFTELGPATKWGPRAKVKDEEWDEPVLDENGNPVWETLFTYDLLKGGGPIISKEEAEAVRKTARWKRPYANRDNFRTYPLVGVLLCKNCLGPMRGTGNTKKNGKTFLYYKHMREQHRKVGCVMNQRADELERIVFGWVERTLTGKYPLKEAIEYELRSRHKNLPKLEQQKVDLAETVKRLEGEYQNVFDTIPQTRDKNFRGDLVEKGEAINETLSSLRQELDDLRRHLESIKKPLDEKLLGQAEKILKKHFAKRKLNQLDPESKKKIIKWVVGAGDPVECREKGLGIYLAPGEIVIKGQIGVIQVYPEGQPPTSRKTGIKRDYTRTAPELQPDVQGLAKLLLELEAGRAPKGVCSELDSC